MFYGIKFLIYGEDLLKLSDNLKFEKLCFSVLTEIKYGTLYTSKIFYQTDQYCTDLRRTRPEKNWERDVSLTQTVLY